MAYIISKKHGDTTLLKTTALASALMLAVPAMAAEVAADKKSDATLPTVNVKASATTDAPAYKADKASSPKLTQPLLDTPQTITVIKKELLLEQAATTLSEALRNTPGITLLLGENGNTATGDSIFMRGFDTQGSIFVDNIRDLGTISRDTFNTDQVEIAKGPAGADNGRGAASGYVNMGTKLPTLDSAISGTVGLGSGSYKRATLDMNRKLDIEGAAFRLNLMLQDSGVTGRDQVENNSWGVAPSLAFGLNTPTRAYFYLLHVDQENRPDGAVPTIGLQGYYNAALVGKPQAKVDSENFYGALSDKDDVVADMFTARFEHDFAPGITLRNTSRYGKSSQDYVMTGVSALAAANVADANPANWTVNRSRQGKDQENVILTNQTNLTAELATGAVKHSISAGAEVIYESQRNNTLGAVAGQTTDAANLYHPNPNARFAAMAPTGARTKGETTTAALYAFDTIKLSDAFQINGGVRVEHYKTETNTISLSTATSHPTLPVGTPVAGSVSGSDNLVSLKIGALYKPAEKGSVYFSYATSQLPPGSANFSLVTTNGANNPNADPQKGSNIELGTKWDVMGDKLALTAAIYRSQNDNEFVTHTDGSTLPVGKRRVQGVELGAAGILTQNWQISAGLAYMDPKITRGSRSGTNPTDGGVIQWSPKLTFTSWTTYKLPFGLTIGGGARYMDSVARSSSTTINTATNPLVQVPDYWVFDAMAVYDVSKNMNLQLNVYNLADKEYVSTVNNSGARYRPGTPRSARLTANFLF